MTAARGRPLASDSGYRKTAWLCAGGRFLFSGRGQRVLEPAGERARELADVGGYRDLLEFPPGLDALGVKNDPQGFFPSEIEQNADAINPPEPVVFLSQLAHPPVATNGSPRVGADVERDRIPTSSSAAGDVVRHVRAIGADAGDRARFRRLLHSRTSRRPFVALGKRVGNRLIER